MLKSSSQSVERACGSSRLIVSLPWKPWGGVMRAAVQVHVGRGRKGALRGLPPTLQQSQTSE